MKASFAKIIGWIEKHKTKEWLASSKPTDYVTSFSSLLALVGGISTGLYLWFSGYLDNKATLIEDKNTLTKLETTKLEIQKLNLDIENKRIQDSIAANNKELESSKAKVQELASELINTRQALENFRKSQEIAEAEKQGVRWLDYLNSQGVDVKYDRNSNLNVAGVALTQKNSYPPNKKQDPIQFDKLRQFIDALATLPNLKTLAISDIAVDANRLADLVTVP